MALYSLSMYAPDVIASTPIINNVGNHALAFATAPMDANSMAFLRFRYRIQLDNRFHDQLNYIKRYHQLDENQCQILFMLFSPHCKQ